MWCPVDIRDYERRSHDQVSVCMLYEREFKSATLCCLRYMALVASRNTTHHFCETTAPPWRESKTKNVINVCMHKFACTNVTPKRRNGAHFITHALYCA